VTSLAARQKRVQALLEARATPANLDTLTAVLLAVIVEGGPTLLDIDTLSKVLAHAGLRADMTGPEMTRGIITFLEKHPPDPALLAELKAALG
jgi:hypothetical protein